MILYSLFLLPWNTIQTVIFVFQVPSRGQSHNGITIDELRYPITMQHITKYKDTPFQFSSTIFFMLRNKKGQYNKVKLISAKGSIINYFHPRTTVSVSCRPGLVILEEI